MFKSISAQGGKCPNVSPKPKSQLTRLCWSLSALLATGQVSAECFNANQSTTIDALTSLFQNSSAFSGFNTSIPSQFEGSFSDYFQYLVSSSNCDPNLVQNVTPDQITAMGSMATRTNGGKIGRPANYFGLNQKKRGGGSGDSDFPPLNFWAKIDSDFGSRDLTFSQPGFEFDNHNFVFGADYRLKDNWVAGGSFSYRHNNASFNGNRGETVNDSYTGMLYTSYNITDAAHVNATASYGGFSYDTTRNISFLGANSVAKAKPNGGQYAFSWGGGYDFIFDALTVAPYARGEYSNLDIDAYSESGSVFAVRFGKQAIESLTSTLGIQTSYALSFPWGVLIPQLRGEWHHQFMDGARQIEAGFIADPSGQSFVMTSDGPSRDYYTFGAEVSSVFAGGVSAFLAYETLQSYTSINSNKLMLGARLEF
ncbi:autotransporter outer membrane beta-barrel domain-containing protein [Methylomonas sp. SURF-2]|uniref:Autotransporter outer membrane beta-barrel domain-containing protein n=1 Tax=Methylomonas subterranea TaxID=2952225 RepID=A0ABT1TDN3_9GAMM|nr:autotransporter outer membrane beta-barrel domain-containing protein [Methylomonas sp. SURF-2]MCQ8103567.1 autotransporter outer membrane beta-barrel domain-containing protein [Methylomonas sp. SURF-2]